MNWIDTHAHLDAPELSAGRESMLERARAAGVGCAVIPAVAPRRFDALRELAHASGHVYALGVHPLAVAQEQPGDFERLRAALAQALDDPQFVGIGEIGLDFFVPGFDAARQIWWCEQQLRLAREFDLPVLLHLRRAQDPLLAALRKFDVAGIAHAFNGSPQQAEGYLRQGCRIGFGGAMTFARALNIRRLAASLPQGSLVLETDSPDIPPAWLAGSGQPNEPAQLPRIGAVLAELRGWSLAQAAAVTSANACAALPRLAAWLQRRDLNSAPPPP